ncbi:hypothetical protein NEOLEDRAFT_1179937 [Neolentinus lepideus HHB14362 ss-1]|uniref:Aminoglycoside phosphotransferase domain-containing protein n=1 Tax=Neolentinus lepideus HHB14362 ss-1 TaxID=1314782 RepID=A0A165RF45_9AGAM|nr:hypothetical protein NEOLEDRAFT_1179937 [Neolentinus lepideus HHB14362 ss-1]
MPDEESSQMNVILDKLGAHFSDPCITPVMALDRGSHHRTYVVSFTSGVTRVIRISDPHFRQFGSGIVPPSKMRSEVAVIKYVREHTKIPVPDVLFYDEDKDGSVGAEWMVMEYIEGNRLIDVWRDMSPDQRTAAALSIADVYHELLGLRFDKIGSLYDGDKVGPMTFLPSNNRYDIGPPVHTKCGPFSSIREWLIALASGDLDYETSYKTTPEMEKHREAALRVLCSTPVFDDPSVQDLCAISLDHVDMTTSNILVDSQDPTRIVGVIDWEGARTVPLFAIQPRWYAHLGSFGIASSEEVRLSQVYTRQAIRERVPVWYAATEYQGRALREMLNLARCSTWDPANAQFDMGDRYMRGLK